MFSAFLKKQEWPPIHALGNGLVHKPYQPSGPELREIERNFTQLFLSDEGQKVLAHLQRITFNRALGPESSNEQLRYTEGQRSLVATILRLVDRGRRA